MYRQEELELRAKQLLYMRDREELLDEELMSLSPVKQYQTDASFVQANTLQLLQVGVGNDCFVFHTLVIS